MTIGTSNTQLILDNQTRTNSTNEGNERIHNTKPITLRHIRKNHNLSNIIGDRNNGLLSEMELRMVKDLLKDDDWIQEMEEIY